MEMTDAEEPAVCPVPQSLPNEIIKIYPDPILKLTPERSGNVLHNLQKKVLPAKNGKKLSLDIRLRAKSETTKVGTTKSTYPKHGEMQTLGEQVSSNQCNSAGAKKQAVCSKPGIVKSARSELYHNSIYPAARMAKIKQSGTEVVSEPVYVHPSETHKLVPSVQTRKLESFDIVDQGAAISGLSKPEVHTNLKLVDDLQHVKNEQIDLAKAVEERISSSEEALQQLNIKSAAGVEVHEPMFTDLIGLDVTRDRILGEVVEEQIGTTKPQFLSTKIDKVPDLMKYLSDDYWHEPCNFSTEPLSHTQPRGRTTSLSSLLDMIEHRRVCDRAGHS